MRVFILSLVLISTSAFANPSYHEFACSKLSKIEVLSEKESKTRKLFIQSNHMASVLISLLTEAYYIDRTRLDFGQDFADLKKVLGNEAEQLNDKFYKRSEYRAFFKDINSRTKSIQEHNHCL